MVDAGSVSEMTLTGDTIEVDVDRICIKLSPSISANIAPPKINVEQARMKEMPDRKAVPH